MTQSMKTNEAIKRVFLLSVFLLFISNLSFGQKKDSNPSANPELRFLEKRIIDYGRVKSKDVINVDVPFENAGLEPLCMLSVTTTCNCTKAQTDKRVYRHKEKGKIMIRIETEGKHGPQTAVIRVHTNADRPQSIVRIDYFVED